jgi:hypothetical protein
MEFVNEGSTRHSFGRSGISKKPDAHRTVRSESSNQAILPGFDFLRCTHRLIIYLRREMAQLSSCRECMLPFASLPREILGGVRCLRARHAAVQVKRAIVIAPKRPQQTH